MSPTVFAGRTNVVKKKKNRSSPGNFFLGDFRTQPRTRVRLRKKRKNISGTRPVDRAPYRTSPHVQEKIGEQVTNLLKQGMKERTRAWGSPVTIVTKADGSPRFYVGHLSDLLNLERLQYIQPNL